MVEGPAVRCFYFPGALQKDRHPSLMHTSGTRSEPGQPSSVIPSANPQQLLPQPESTRIPRSSQKFVGKISMCSYSSAPVHASNCLCLDTAK